LNAICYAILDTDDAVAELLLGDTKVLVRVGQVLDFVVELFLYLCELLHAELSQVDCDALSVFDQRAWTPKRRTLLALLTGSHDTKSLL
jgi:hypothetical protein